MALLSGKWWTMAALCLMLALTNIDLTAVNLALAHISQDFHTSLATLQWVMIGYMLALAASIVLGGDLGDKVGRKRMFLIGAAIFIIASIFAGLSQNSWQLIFARVIQGFGMAMIFPQTVVIAMLIFPAEQQGLAIGVIASAAGISQAIGPTIGGYLLTWLNWRWIFFINIPIGLIVILFGALTIKESSIKSKQAPIDYMGSCFIIVALTFLLLALSQLQNWGMTSLLFIGCLSAAIIFLVIFFAYENRIKTPLVPFKLLNDRLFLVGSFVRFLFTIGFSTILFLMGLYLQNVRGLSAANAGFVMLALTIVFGIGSMFGGNLVDRYGNRSLMSIGMLLFVIGFIILALIDVQAKFIFLLLALVLLGIGLAVMVPATTTAALSKIPDDKKGIVSGVYYGLAFLAFSLGVAISTALLSSVASHKFKHLLNLTNINLNHAQLSSLKLIYTGTHDPNIFLSQYGHVAKLAPLVKDAQLSFMSGFHAVMLFCAFVSLIGFIVALVVDY